MSLKLFLCAIMFLNKYRILPQNVLEFHLMFFVSTLGATSCAMCQIGDVGHDIGRSWDNPKLRCWHLSLLRSTDNQNDVINLGLSHVGSTLLL